jgi:DNA-directed RNA polymerase specialized sigma subunit
MHLSASEIKKLLQGWHFYKASISSSEDGGTLAKKICAVEKAIAALPEIDQTIIRKKYIQRIDGDIVAAQVHITRRAVYYRIKRAFRDMEYMICNSA